MLAILLIAVVVLIIVGLLNHLNSCTHGWKVYREFDIKRASDGKILGICRVSECEYCKKIRKQEIEYNL